MSYRTIETADAVTLEPISPAKGAVILLHGLGADGHDFAPLVPELHLPDSLGVRFVFPHAAVRPVTLNNGYQMRAWYDILGLSLTAQEDERGIRESEKLVHHFIEQQLASGLLSNRIVIAGFSQGGAIALHTALRYPQRLAGVIALSTYLPLRDALTDERTSANQATPIFMCHGTQDPIVPLAMGEMARDSLLGLGYAVTWKSYAMPHSVCPEEVIDIARWVAELL
jgi:phospholipase/carboxylesterase